jgi:radical SAM superfamily enzyme YgiQ (UPF0313 family)
MKILLVDIDSKIPNLALKKIEKYHVDCGNDVKWYDHLLMINWADKIYVSCVFTKNKHLCEEWEGKAEIGGTGYDINKTLPEEIESVNPKINFGFTTRGCIRKCKFCFVPEKEGTIHIVGDIYDIWDEKSKNIVLMDNNILAVPEHFKMICKQVRKNYLRVDFNQGLDIRLLTEDFAEELKKTKMRQIRFSFDSPKLKPIIKNKISILKKMKIRADWYVLVGFDSDIEEEIDRVRFLVDNNQRAYIMRHENCLKDKRYIALSRWANAPFLGKGTIPFNEYLETNDGKRYKKYFHNVGVY